MRLGVNIQERELTLEHELEETHPPDLLLLQGQDGLHCVRDCGGSQWTPRNWIIQTDNSISIDFISVNTDFPFIFV